MQERAKPHWAEGIDCSPYHAAGRYYRGFHINAPVFTVSGLVITALIVATVLGGSTSAAVLDTIRNAIVTHFDSFLMSVGDLFLLACIVLILSPYGSIRLGRDDEKPQFSTPAWFAMLFGAGMGIGLIFYGVAEPVTHFGTSLADTAGTAASGAPLGGAPGDADKSRSLALSAAIFNWGLHPWAIYGVMGLALALFAYRFDMPLSIRSTFYPLFGKAVWGRLGDVIDVLAVFATLGGLSTSLGLGAQQAMAGISFLYGVPASAGWVIALVAVMALFTFLSVWGGIERGIRMMSEANLWLAGALALFILVTGPTALLFERLVGNTGDYLANLVPLSNPFGRTDVSFFQNWSVYYWTWWISWAPFVGMFMARISRGRTVRGFLIGALIAPTALSVAWMTVFGDTAIWQILSGSGAGASLASAPVEAQLFLMLEGLPWPGITCFLALILVLIFFITGWDSGTLVIDSMTAGGKLDTRLIQRVLWLLVVGAAAVVLLLTGGLLAVQTASIVTGLPLAVVTLVLSLGLFRGLHAARTRPCGPIEAESAT